MPNQLLEIIGLFVIALGLGAVVAAASLVSLALAVLAAGVFLVLVGLTVVYAAATLEAASSRSATTKVEGAA